MLPLANSADNPSETILSHLEGTTVLTKKDAVRGSGLNPLFSIFNATYNDDQKKSHADYIELSMQVQFNQRAL